MGSESHSNDETVDFEQKTVPSPALASKVFSPDESEQTRWNQLLTRGIGNYVLKGILGRGTFGTVYQAHDEALDRHVAIKVLNNPLDADGMELFQQEARVIASLSKHPNIVQIHQWGECDGCPYFVLEYIESSASDMLRQYPTGLPKELALRIVGAAAGALAHAHRQSVLHRDIKPANILMEDEGHTVKLADFGLAFQQKLEGSDKGVMAGSPPYMSPEQIECRQLDGRADIFSLGVTLYQLLCGKLPFAGRTASELFQNIRQNQYQPIAQMLPDLPPEICAIVDKATAHQPDKRFADADAMADAIGGLLGGRPDAEFQETLRQVEQRARRRSWIFGGVGAAAAAVIVLLLIPLGFFGVGEGNPVLAQAREQLDLGDYAGAESLYRSVLDESPGNSDALYGAGFARLFQGAPTEASALFEAISAQPRLRYEGIAAVAANADAQNARTVIEGAAQEGNAAYATVLLARLDMLQQQHEAVVQRLDKMSNADFYFKWQLREALQLLGQAYYGMGQFAKAGEHFQQLRELGGRQEVVATSYLRLIDQQVAMAKNENIRELAERIAEMMKRGEVHSVADPWTSRPFTAFILPVESPLTPFAVESGLGDMLPSFLAEQLAEKTNIRVVDREQIQAVLMEQELSANLSSKSGQLQLGQVLGARLIVLPKFLRFRGQDSIKLTIVDVETTQDRSIPSINLSDALSSEEELIDDLASRLQEKVAQEYPLRARLYLQEEAAYINIGSENGVQSDQVFDVFKDPDMPPLPQARVVVTPSIGAQAAQVRVEGLTASDLPDNAENGWFVQRRAIGT